MTMGTQLFSGDGMALFLEMGIIKRGSKVAKSLSAFRLGVEIQRETIWRENQATIMVRRRHCWGC
jgi:hypothetical protein